MEGKQAKSRKTPASRPHLSHQAQSSPIQLPSHRQQPRSTSTPNSAPHQRPQSHSTNHSFVTTPEFQSASGFDYDDLSTATMPTSSLLNQLLQEKKASQLQFRQGRRHASDFEVYKRLPRTSPTEVARQEAQRQVSGGPSGDSGSSHGKPKEMGAREMMAFIDKMKKENFDLKLQLYHQRLKKDTLEHQMEEKTEQIQALVTENTQLRETNTRLSHEVRKTQSAVDEAVAIICEHEEKLADLGVSQDTRPSTARPGDAGTDTPVRPSSRSGPVTPTRFEVPHRGSSKRATQSGEPSRRSANSKTSKQTKRTPSFLRESHGSSSALRSLYLTDENKSKGAFSVMSMTGSMFLREDPDPETMTMDSPRLSVLSESSFMSVYGSPKHLDLNDGRPGRDDVIFADTPMKNQRVHQWVNSREVLVDPSRRSTSISTTGGVVVPSKVTEQLDDAAPAPIISKEPLNAHQVAPAPQIRTRKPYKMDSPSLAGPIFGHDILPPTPDTMSTSNPDALNRSTSSIVAEKGLVDRVPVDAGYADVVISASRPHTSDGNESRSALVEDDFDNFSEETQHGRRARRSSLYQNHTFSTHRTASFMSGGSSKAIRMLGPGAPSNPRLSCYGGNLMFNGEGIEDVVSSQFAPPIRSRPSRESAHHVHPVLPVEQPEEWLAPGADDISPPVEEPFRRRSTSTGRVSFDVEVKDAPPVAFRMRVPPPAAPVTKRMSLKSRIFSRSSNSSARASDSDSCHAAPAPSIRDARPMTAGSNQRRRSASLFGWMRTASRDGQGEAQRAP